MLKDNKISRQALDTIIYELVGESKFKNILNVGRIWLRFRENNNKENEEKRPFRIPLRKKRTHSNISSGDIIQIANKFYVVDQVGARKIEAINLSIQI